MKVYRYEMPDGGGPFFTLSGIQRRTGVCVQVSTYVFGCLNKDDLVNHFHGTLDFPEECKIVTREIPDDVIINVGNQVMFPKEFVREDTLADVEY